MNILTLLIRNHTNYCLFHFKMSMKYSDGELNIRRAKKDDMTAIAEMIQVRRERITLYLFMFKNHSKIKVLCNFQELADFEKMPDGPKLSVTGL